jgi:hypothetical protein
VTTGPERILVCSYIRALVHGNTPCDIKEQISIDEVNDIGENLKMLCERSDQN